MSERIIDTLTVQIKLGGISTSGLGSLRKEDSAFPKPIKAAGINGWREADIDEWIRRRSEQANG